MSERTAGECHLENGSYSVHLTARGTGWSAFGNRLVTSGADYPDVDGGVRVYIRDPDCGPGWGLAVDAAARRPERFACRLGPDPALVRADDGLDTEVRVALAGDAAAEVRRITLANRSGRRRVVEVTTAVPLALDLRDAFAAHPAFSKLFIQTSYLAPSQGLAAVRRPRSPDEPAVAAVHFLIPGDGVPSDPPAYETDRARFLGRGRGWARPAALEPGARLDGTVGNVLDPVLTLRRTLVLDPGASATLTAVVGAGLSLDAALEAASRHPGPAGPPAEIVWNEADEARGAALLEAVYGGATPAGGGRGGPVTAAAGEPARPGDGAGDRAGAHAGDRAGEVTPRPRTDGPAPEPTGSDHLRFFNGYGGFTEAGDEYVIPMANATGRPERPPQPWVNVVANDAIGFIVSESGAGCTWAGNSRLNRLTPWSNDPVTDPYGESFCLRDEETGRAWSPLPGPLPGPGDYEARHGHGYSRWRHASEGLDQEVWQFVAERDPVKLVLLKVTNRSGRPRRLTAMGGLEWVLGAGAEARRSVVARVAGPGLVLARNPGTADFRDAVAFAAAVGGVRVRAGEPGDDGPRAALRIALNVTAGDTAWCGFLLGQGGSEEEARALVARFGAPEAMQAELGRVRAAWRSLAGRVRVETPSPALDLMLNGWLLYQGVSCRLRGRSAFYQSGGAYGYRDQLQDAAGVIYHDPGLTRRQILLHAAHQFPEGDVLHWWHPPAGWGMRTRFSDDLLWLPYVTGFYLDVTGDASVLDERVPFVEGPALAPGEDERYMLPSRSPREATVHEHACLAIDRSLTRGAHGLPLMGTGDWNDGMNRVGREGRGESVWLGFFLATILRRWIPLCGARGEADRADRYRDHLRSLEGALEEAGWDGAWYRRAYYDDGAPIGSAESDECRIDAIAQAWAVLSRVARPDRADAALDALETHLVDEDAGLIRLLTPPFDATPHDPGYIKGYLPGVRENGGQYTHGVLWAVRALAEAGRGERALPLLEMLLPVHRARLPEDVARYRIEPYVVAADVYGEDPHVGRGGWTWYTGSAGWMVRVALESILGFEVLGGDRLRLRPCIPAAWPGFRITYTLPGDTGVYEIRVARTDGATAARLDGGAIEVVDGVPVIPLLRDGARHIVEVALGAEACRGYRPASSRAAPPDAMTSA